MPTPIQSHRRFRFSLRTLLLAVIVVAIPLAWVAKERRQSKYEQQIAEELRKRGFEVELAGPYDSFDRNFRVQPPGWWNDQARACLGSRIVMIYGGPIDVDEIASFSGLTNLQLLELDRAQVSDISTLSRLKALRALDVEGTQIKELRQITNLANLEHLNIGATPIEDFTSLGELTKLRFLFIRNSKITDLAPLASLHNLQTLDLRGTQVSDLKALARNTKLTKLNVTKSPITKDQVDALQKALPNCTISHDPFP